MLARVPCSCPPGLLDASFQTPGCCGQVGGWGKTLFAAMAADQMQSTPETSLSCLTHLSGEKCPSLALQPAFWILDMCGRSGHPHQAQVLIMPHVDVIYIYIYY